MILSHARIAFSLLVCTIILIAPTRNTNAAISSGADGLFQPLNDVTLTVPGDGIFDFTEVKVDAGITVSFAGAPRSVTWLALESIAIAGMINANGWALELEPPGLISIQETGAIQAGSIAAV